MPKRKRFISVGDTVVWRGFSGGHEALPATVVGIELCEPGEKYGKPVNKIHSAFKDRCVFTVQAQGKHTRNWAYGEQISIQSKS